MAFIKVLLLCFVVAFVQSQEQPNGFASLNGGTTGGAGGEIVYVSTEAELFEAISGDEPRVVKIEGIIELSEVARVGSNKSILGVNANSGISNSGFLIRQQSNVIIRGLQIFKAIAPDDGVSIDEATNVWVDHNDFYSDLEHDKDYYDGLLDVKHAADYITISYNRFHDHYKCSLVGHSDDNADEDVGKLKLTYHHNWFSKCNSRLPSLRFGTGHIYNNVYEDGDTSGINSRMGAEVLVEGNIFRNVKRPLITNLDSDEDGFAVERGNDWGDTVPEITQEGTFTDPPYSYQLDDLEDVEDIVKEQAGNTVFFP